MSLVRRQYYCWVWSLFVFGASVLADQATAWGASPVDAEHLTFVGRVFVEPVDTRRVLVAVTTRMDGSSEHLFLYTASTPLSVTPRFRNLLATVYYETGGGLRITPAANDAQTLEFVVTAGFGTHGSIRFEQTLGLSHYVANPRLQFQDLQALNKTADCDHAPRACVQVAGQFLPFPG
jgi:hypothetical protein